MRKKEAHQIKWQKIVMQTQEIHQKKNINSYKPTNVYYYDLIN